jgi:hypothetical protein
MKKLILSLLMFPSISMAEFLCDEEAGQLKVNVYHACGIAEHVSEQRARSMAFDYAKEEFIKFCSSSSNCKDKEVDLNPKRTICKEEKGYFKCVRLIEYTIKGMGSTDKWVIEN